MLKLEKRIQTAPPGEIPATLSFIRGNLNHVHLSRKPESKAHAVAVASAGHCHSGCLPDPVFLCTGPGDRHGPAMVQHKQLLSWAELFDSASIDEKKVIASQLIKAVTLSRNYGIQIEFNISEAQFLNGMEMR